MSIWLALVVILLAFYVMTEIVDRHFIKSLDNIAEWMKLPPSVAGATLLALGTSAPEISTALFALFLEGANPATGVGTIVGSAIFQILVVIGFAAVVKTSYLNWRPVMRDSIFYAFSVGLLILFVADNKFTLIEGIAFVCSYFLYLFVLFLWTKYVNEEATTPKNGFETPAGSARAEFEGAAHHLDTPRPIEAIEKDMEDETRRNPFKILQKTLGYPVEFLMNLIPDPEEKPRWTIPVFLLSLVIIAGASYFLVVAAEALAKAMDIPPAIIALTILAGGSSIPEMISSAIVAKQGRGDMAIANAIGSNIFDILMSLGLPVLIYILIKGQPLTDLGGANITSSIILLFTTLIVVVLLLFVQKFKATRPFGLFLIFLYLIYVVAAYMGWIGG
ncbi:calcium/sodium antiporter [Microscilla marina]|uniref:Putative K+-dependent Na+/Ca+ exchanger-like protein n=1 Tax=Microscilla marina ATCC 23134 TaxID=313606 RepID=A1ZFW8_MICM2|nr:calcium/sodium antiporter [Microscilla marina]EAY30892.1 putative K+-dependent Na+/Ca+ exchanger-like protein [Microscilla marina ATCC 23134]